MQKHKRQNRSARVPSPTICDQEKLIASQFLTVERNDTQPATWRQMASKLQNNQPSAVICRVSCQQPPTGSACVKQTFAQGPFSCLFVFFILFLSFIFLSFFLSFILFHLFYFYHYLHTFVRNQGKVSPAKMTFKICDVWLRFSCLLHFAKGLKCLREKSHKHTINKKYKLSCIWKKIGVQKCSSDYENCHIFASALLNVAQASFLSLSVYVIMHLQSSSNSRVQGR